MTLSTIGKQARDLLSELEAPLVMVDLGPSLSNTLLQYDVCLRFRYLVSWRVKGSGGYPSLVAKAVLQETIPIRELYPSFDVSLSIKACYT